MFIYKRGKKVWKSEITALVRTGELLSRQWEQGPVLAMEQPWGSVPDSSPAVSASPSPAYTCYPTSLLAWTGSSFSKAFLFKMPGKERLLPVKKKKKALLCMEKKRKTKSNIKRIRTIFLISSVSERIHVGKCLATFVLSLSRIQVVFYPWHIL